MKLRSLFLALVGALCVASAAEAVEPYMQFLQGLRARGYDDYALMYLQQIEADPDAPADVKAVVPYEKALTLLGLSRRTQNPDTQNEYLDQALAFLAEFVKNNPQHPLAAGADTERGKILFGKGQVAIWQSKSPSQAGQKASHQERARELIGQAREIFQAAHDKHQAAYEAFPKFIEEATQKDLYEQRAAAEIRYLSAQLDLAKCTYETAQSYDADAPEYTKLLTDAALEFEQIHQKYRSMVGGLYARIWQAKCFEEQGDLQKALGIYNEFLSNPGTSPAMLRFKDQVLQFRLICLNHDDRRDYELVVNEGGDWMTARKTRLKSSVGLGIRWEVARAWEQLGLDRTKAEATRNSALRQAKTEAEFLKAYPGQYQEPAIAMLRRIELALRGEEAGDPQEFDTAYAMAKNLFAGVAEMREQVEAETEPEARRKLQVELDLHLKETARMLSLALSLVDEDTPLTDVNRTRYTLAYVYYLMRRSYEAAVLGEYIARHYHREDDKTALDAAYLAMGAWQQAFNDVVPGRSRDTETNMLVRVGELIAEHWPTSDKANDARMTVGRMYGQQQRPAEAAAAYSQVPESSERFADAQVAAGQAYWTAYLASYGRPEEDRPSADELQQWQTAAEKHLRAGIEKVQATISTEGKPTDQLIAAKVSLAQILINSGRDKDAVELLTGEPHPVTAAIEVENEDDRPMEGITSKPFAALCYQLLLRGYVGTQQIDAALEAMDKLQALGEEDSTEIYVQLGRELENELKRSAPERQAEVRAAFEAFLAELFKLPDMNYGALLWIGQTYYSLAEGLGEDNPEALPFFGKAADTYQRILELDPSLGRPPDDKLTGVKLQLVKCRRQQKEYEQAFKLVSEILKVQPTALNAQFEAAYVLQEWGTSGQADDQEKLHDALAGVKDAGVWGWGIISQKLLQALGGPNPTDEFLDKYLEARYNISVCTYQRGKQQPESKRQEGLEQAKNQIEAFVLAGSEITDKWWTEFDSLYQQIQKDMGISVPERLERPEPVAVVQQPVTNGSTETADDEPKVTNEEPTQEVAAEDDSGPSLVLILIAVLIAGGGGVGFVVMMGRRKPKRRMVYAESVTVPKPSSQSPPKKTATSVPAVGPRRVVKKKKKKVVRPSGAAPGAQDQGRPKST